jgi:hypothetical protein
MAPSVILIDEAEKASGHFSYIRPPLHAAKLAQSCCYAADGMHSTTMAMPQL